MKNWRHGAYEQQAERRSQEEVDNIACAMLNSCLVYSGNVDDVFYGRRGASGSSGLYQDTKVTNNNFRRSERAIAINNTVKKRRLFGVLLYTPAMTFKRCHNIKLMTNWCQYRHDGRLAERCFLFAWCPQNFNPLSISNFGRPVPLFFLFISLS